VVGIRKKERKKEKIESKSNSNVTGLVKKM
jgi:hypothetical protein